MVAAELTTEYKVAQEQLIVAKLATSLPARSIPAQLPNLAIGKRKKQAAIWDLHGPQLIEELKTDINRLRAEQRPSLNAVTADSYVVTAIDALAFRSGGWESFEIFLELASHHGIEVAAVRATRGNSIASLNEVPSAAGASAGTSTEPPPVPEPAHTRGAAQAEERSLELAALAQLLAALTPVDAAQLGAMLAPTRWELRAREVSKGPSAPQCGTAPLDVRACKRNCLSSIQQKLAHARSHMPVRLPLCWRGPRRPAATAACAASPGTVRAFPAIQGILLNRKF